MCVIIWDIRYDLPSMPSTSYFWPLYREYIGCIEVTKFDVRNSNISIDLGKNEEGVFAQRIRRGEFWESLKQWNADCDKNFKK